MLLNINHINKQPNRTTSLLKTGFVELFHRQMLHNPQNKYKPNTNNVFMDSQSHQL